MADPNSSGGSGNRTRFSLHRLRFIDSRPSGGVCTALHPSGHFLALARENGDIELWACDSQRFAYGATAGGSSGNMNLVALGMPVPWTILAVIPGSVRIGVQSMTWARAAGSALNAKDGGKGGSSMGPSSTAVPSLTVGGGNNSNSNNNSDGPGLGGSRLLVSTLSGTLYEGDWATLSLHKLGDSHGGAAWCVTSFPLSSPSFPSVCLGSVVAVGCEDGTVRLWTMTEEDSDESLRSSGSSNSGSSSVCRLDYAAQCPGGSDGRVLCASWHPTLPVLFTGTSHGVIRGWDVSGVTSALVAGPRGSKVTSVKAISVLTNLSSLLSRAAAGGGGGGSNSGGSGGAVSPSPVVRMQLDSAMPGLAATTTHGKPGASGPSTCVWSLAVTSELLVVTGDSKGQVLVWDGRSGTLAVPAPVQRHDADVLTVAVVETADLSGAAAPLLQVASGGIDGKVHLIRRLTEAEHGRHARATAASRWVAVGSHRGHAHDVRSLVFHPSASWIAGVSADGFLSVIAPWDISLRQPLRLPPFGQRPTKSLAFACPPELAASSSPSSSSSGSGNNNKARGSALQAPLLIASQQDCGVDLWLTASAPAAPTTVAIPPSSSSSSSSSTASKMNSDGTLSSSAADATSTEPAIKIGPDGGVMLEEDGKDGKRRGRKHGANASAPDSSSSANAPVAPLHERLLRIECETIQLPYGSGSGSAADGGPRSATGAGVKRKRGSDNVVTTASGATVSKALLALAPQLMKSKNPLVAAGEAAAEVARMRSKLLHTNNNPSDPAAGTSNGDDDEGDAGVEVEDDGHVPLANPSCVVLSRDGRWLAYATAAGLKLLRLSLEPGSAAGSSPSSSSSNTSGGKQSPAEKAAAAAVAAHAAAVATLRGTDVDPLPVALPHQLVTSGGVGGLKAGVSQLHLAPLSGGHASNAQLLVVAAGGRLHVSVCFDLQQQKNNNSTSSLPKPSCLYLYSLPIPSGPAAAAALGNGTAASAYAGFISAAARAALMSGGLQLNGSNSSAAASSPSKLNSATSALDTSSSSSSSSAAGGRSGGVKIASAALALAGSSSSRRKSAGTVRGRLDSDASTVVDSDTGEDAGASSSSSVPNGVASLAALNAGSSSFASSSSVGPLFVTAVASYSHTAPASSSSSDVTLAVATHDGHVSIYRLGLTSGRLTGVTPRANSQATALALAALPASSKQQPSVVAVFALLRGGGALVADAATGTPLPWSSSLSTALSQTWHGAAAGVSSVGGTGGSGAVLTNGSVAKAAQFSPPVPRTLLVVPAESSSNNNGVSSSLKLLAFGSDVGASVTLDFPTSTSSSSSSSGSGGPAIEVRPLPPASARKGREAKGMPSFSNLLGAAVVPTHPQAPVSPSSASGSGNTDGEAGKNKGSSSKASVPSWTLAAVELPWRAYARHLSAVLARKRYGT